MVLLERTNKTKKEKKNAKKDEMRGKMCVCVFSGVSLWAHHLESRHRRPLIFILFALCEEMPKL